MQNSQQIFKLHSEYQPTGDQPEAIAQLTEPVTSHRQLRNWSKDSKKATSLRLCWVSQVPVRPSPWRTSSPVSTSQLWYLRTIKHLRLSCTVSLKNSSLRTQWNTLYPTTTIISRKHMFHLRTHTLPRIRPSMTRLISFDSPQLCH